MGSGAHVNPSLRWVCVALVMGLAGCASPGDVSHKLEYCCGTNEVPLSSYTIQLNDIPGFLVPYLRDELIAALAEKGMREVPSGGQANVSLTYSEIYPDAGQAVVDDGFGDPLATARSRQFVAVVTLEIRRAANGAEVLRGTLSRMHTVSVGEYMHERARTAIRAGFDRLLKRLPQAAQP
jgi:hypothetical protein